MQKSCYYLAILLLLICALHVTQANSQTTRSTITIDNRTRKIVKKFTHVVTKKKELIISEKFLILASQIKKIADSLKKKRTPAAKILRRQLLAIVKDFLRRAKHPAADLLKASLKDVQHLKKKSKKNTLWVQKVVIGGLLVTGEAMNFLNGLGTYSTQVSNVANFIAGPISKILNKLGMKKIARAANKVGSAISKFTMTRLAPIENKAAKAVAPIVKNKAFQIVRKTLNVVNGLLSFRAGFKILGLAPKLFYPKNFKILKQSLQTATKLIKNRKLLSAIKKGVKSGFKQIKSSLKRAVKDKKTWIKIKNAALKFKDGIKFFKKAKSQKSKRKKSKKSKRSVKKSKKNGKKSRITERISIPIQKSNNKKYSLDSLFKNSKNRKCKYFVKFE